MKRKREESQDSFNVEILDETDLQHPTKKFKKNNDTFGFAPLLNSKNNIDVTIQQKNEVKTVENVNTVPQKNTADGFVYDKFQTACVKLVENGKSCCIIGPAGSGKSKVIEDIVAVFKKGYKSYGVCSTTGISALNIGGCTINRFLGYGHARNFNEMLAKSKNRENNWRVDCIIVDEFSMLDAELLDSLECIARIRRENDVFFGGLQIVLVVLGKANGKFSKGMFAFKSKTFSKLDFLVNLGNIYRQKNVKFIDLLSRVRLGCPTKEDLLVLFACVDENYMEKVENALSKNIIVPTYLTASKQESAKINNKFLSQITQPLHIIPCFDGSEGVSTENIKIILDETQAEPVLQLKKHAQVILVYNLDSKFVNGRRGVVEKIRKLKRVTAERELLENVVSSFQIRAFQDYLEKTNCTHVFVPYIKFGSITKPVFPVKFEVDLGENKKCFRLQIPLKLGWSITIHKSQGMTIDKACIATEKIFMSGMFYVASK